ncbi:MAG: 2OG-Fe(II) oxygenase [Candidatus Anammoxibacter sp.]
MKIEGIIHPDEFCARGYCIKHDFLTKQECQELLTFIEEYRQVHNVPHIYRKQRGRSLNYNVIDGEKIKEHLIRIDRLYSNINSVVNKTTGQEMAKLKNARVGVNVNITPSGGEYRWHYDRNAITGILYLNEVEGGETECYPDYRMFFREIRYSRFQRYIDSFLQIGFVRKVFGKKVLIKPRRGSLVLMHGNRCLHSVRKVQGSTDRINIILAYDIPNADFTIAEKLDSYIYNEDASHISDPNYQ